MARKFFKTFNEHVAVDGFSYVYPFRMIVLYSNLIFNRREINLYGFSCVASPSVYVRYR